MRDINKIILHCSDSEFGDARLIRHWHTHERGWSDIGYHYIVTNGIINSGDLYDADKDGLIEIGRDYSRPGAHCKGHNADSIGICLIGRRHFTSRQLFKSLPPLIATLFKAFDLKIDAVYPHNAFNAGKTCPNFDTDYIKILTEKLLKKDFSKIKKERLPSCLMLT